MTNTISGFETISSHNASLIQSPTTIKCLADVLKYIKTVLDDDGTTTLFQMIQLHVETHDVSAHKLNIQKLSDVIFNSVYIQFFESGKYTGTATEFIPWLLYHPAIYENTLPTISLDEFTTGLTLRIVYEWFEQYHNGIIAPHDNTLTLKINELMSVSNGVPRFTIYPENAEHFRFAQCSIASYNNLIGLLSNRLLSRPPSRRIIDYWSNSDTAETSAMGLGELADYLVEYGEPSTTYVHRKSLDYYQDHSDFLLQDWMSPSDITYITNARQNVNADYSKAVHLFSATSKYSSSFYVRGTINKLTDKPLDIINIVGLRASLGCISIVPYDDAGVMKNKIVASFGNYNQEATGVLADNLLDGITEFRAILVFSRDKCTAHIVIEDMHTNLEFSLTGLTISDPHYLFISPKIGYYSPGTIRVQQIRVYGIALDDSSIRAITSGFSQRAITI